jgi:hypothetical protein
MVARPRAAVAFVVLVGPALLSLVLGSAPAGASAAPRPTVVLAVWTESPIANLVFEPDSHEEPADRLLRMLDAAPGAAVGLLSSIQGEYTRQQVLLDISQGSRQPVSLYSGEPPVVRVVHDRVGAHVAGWSAVRRRARDVSVTLRPGLLAGAVPGGAGFVSSRGLDEVGLAAADERGRIAAISTGSAPTIARRTSDLLATQQLVVVALPGGEGGRSALADLLSTRASDQLLLVAHVPPTPPDRAFALPPSRTYRLVAFGMAQARRESVRSASTRRPGLVSAIDLVPTALGHLRLPVPDAVRGEPVRATDGPDAARLEQLRRRWSDVRGGRQSSSLSGVAGLTLLVMLLLGTVKGLRAALRPGLRIGALAVMWWPTLVLLVAALEPGSKGAETALIATGSIALGAVTDGLLRWPRGPVLPAVAGLGAYTVDLATGGGLLTRSALGPSLLSGSRFYGISNELEPLLPILALVGLAAFVGARRPSRRLCVAFAACGAALGVVVGWGRLGADVGGVLTVAGGFAVATLLMLPGGITRRALLAAAAVPFVALAALVVIDLALGGGGHLSRNLTRSEGSADLLELVTRRYELALNVLLKGRTLTTFLGAALGIAFAVRNRALLYAPVRNRAWHAALVGGLAAGVMGAITNDSGPLLLTNAVIALAAVTAYVQGCPDLVAGGGGSAAA